MPPRLLGLNLLSLLIHFTPMAILLALRPRSGLAGYSTFALRSQLASSLSRLEDAIKYSWCFTCHLRLALSARLHETIPALFHCPLSRGRSASRGRDRVGALRSHIKGPGAPGGIAFFPCPLRSLQDVSFCNAVVCGVGGDGRRGDRSTEGTFSFKVSGCNRTSHTNSAGSERRSHRGGRGTPQEELGAHQLSSGSSQVHD
ncbi:hypothetical protein C7M84_005994 [Penaeus vannamei]|uniref:Secreted protein n=1 Tax=Penaeus vannamei TaxID=6689 RepID=A0A3R7M820_PENVA|nr:hypothetical protein C7M84_005994 [Penaeus vannamei]